MSKRYSQGRRALAECGRSGKRVPYRDLVDDGYIKGLRVAPDWFEPEHPLDKPVDASEGIALYRPAPEISIPDGEGEAAPVLTFEPYD
jgi:hypothetical protein